MPDHIQKFPLSVFLINKGTTMNDIRRDKKRARQGIKPKIHNEIAMRFPSRRSGVPCSQGQQASAPSPCEAHGR
jgi:hypothetical protein